MELLYRTLDAESNNVNKYWRRIRMKRDKQPVLEMDGIVKRFPGVVANDHVSFSVTDGEIHGLLGENGAGKSTLMKVLYGLYTPDEGEIWMNGTRLDLDSPRDAIEAGIGMVHQHFKLVPRLSVVENVVLGERKVDEGVAGGMLPAWVPFSDSLRALRSNREESRERVVDLIDQYGFGVDPDASVWELDVGERQRVEILKSLYRDADLLVLDEPTAVLSPTESRELFETLRRLTESGLTVILITHKLDEAIEHTDRTTVLRDGSVVDCVSTNRVSKADLAEMMVGRDVLFDIEGVDRMTSSDPVVEADGLCAEDERGIEAVSGVTLTVNRSEIVGVAGVSGNGQKELAECLAGVRNATAGSITVNGRDLTNSSPRDFIDADVSYIPEDRYEHGCTPDRSVLENAILKDRDSYGRVFLDRTDARADAEQIVEQFDVRVPGVDTPANKLSGGNLQKLICGRELNRNPDFLVANQPTRGIDVGAIEYIREVLLEQRDDGTGILLVSEDLDEVFQMSDRIVVLYEGSIVYEVDATEATREEIGQYITGADSADDEPTNGEETGDATAQTGVEA
jgi:simple sugar transport system ATP-binding protein